MYPEKLFMVLGLGDKASCPKEIFCLPIDIIEYPAIFRSKLNKNKHNHATFRYKRGELY